MNIATIFESIKRTSPTFPIFRTQTAILFECEENYLVMYAENLTGEVVHLLRPDGYPQIEKNLLTN